MALILGLFDEAWQHRKMRHRTIAAGFLIALIAVSAGLLIGRAGNVSIVRAGGLDHRSALVSRVLASHSAIVVANTSSRGSVGFATVRLKYPAASVFASVNGSQYTRLAPVIPAASVPDLAIGFAGPLTPVRLSRLTRLGSHHIKLNAVVRLRIEYPNRKWLATAFRASVALGT
jgi:hypothetical protein